MITNIGIIDSQKIGRITGYYDIAYSNITGSGTSTINLQNIPSNYKVLQIKAYLRSDAAQTVSGFAMRINGQTDANYVWQNYISNSNTAQQNAIAPSSAQTAWNFGGSAVPAANASAGNFGCFVITMTGHADNNQTYKSVLGYGGYTDVGAGAQGGLFGQFGGMYLGNKNDITSLQFVINNGNFATGSYVHVYGVA